MGAMNIIEAFTGRSAWLQELVSIVWVGDRGAGSGSGEGRRRWVGRRAGLLALVAAGGVGLWTGEARGENKVLFIGNSFTIGSGGGGVPGIFDRLAQAGGQADPTTVMRADGGVDYQYHSTNATTQTAITSQPWTHVVLQNYSTEPTHLVDGTHSLAHHFSSGTQLYQQVLSNNPATRVVLFETWSRAAAHSLIAGVSSPTSYASTTEFQGELRSNYHRLANQLNAAFPANPRVQVAPVGDAWENAGGLRAEADPGFLDLHGSDNYHGNNNGYYLAAAVLYSQIYGVSPHGLSTNPLVSGLNLGLTVDATKLEDVAWATVLAANAAEAQTFLFDFGASGNTTDHAAAPDDPTNYWNNVTAEIGTTPTGQLTNLVTVQNMPTSVGLVMVSRFGGANTGGTTGSAIFPTEATRDSLYGNTELFSGLTNIFPSFKLTGLDASLVYQFTFYASRAAVADNRETGYTVTGATTGFAALNAANNTNNVATVAGLRPNGAGEILVSLAPTANNNNANHFTYLGVMKVEATLPQQPIAFTLEPVSQRVVAGQSVTFSAAVQGTPPYFIQWTSNGVPIAGASALSYTLPLVTTNMSGALFAVTVSNSFSGLTSSNALLTVIPDTAPPVAQALLFDFGAVGTTTEHGAAPDDPANYWNNVTVTLGSSPTGQLLNLVDTRNTPTGIGLVMVSRFNSVNENGTQSSTLYPSDATRDSLFGNTETFNGVANLFPSFKLTGLDPAATYNFSFYASRTGVSDNRETGYTVTGGNSGFTTLNAANNVDGTSATVSRITPNAAGEISISLAPTANNNNGNHFTYLGVMKMEVAVVQQPVVFTQEPVSQRVVVFRPVSFSAAVQGTPPYFVQWYSNGLAIAGAQQFTYTIPSVSAEADGALFSVSVSNLSYSATSSNALLRVITDTNPPVLLAVSTADGRTLQLTFSELMDPATVTEALNYQLNDGASVVETAALLPDGLTVLLTPTERLTGQFTVFASMLQDLSGNVMEPTTLSGEVPDPNKESLLFDFGAVGTPTSHGPVPGDPSNYWNNVTANVGTSASGQLLDLVTTQNTPTPFGLVILSPFNGANENGTALSSLFPTNATRDSLYGNTEIWNGLTNIFPSFKLTGLNPAQSFRLTFYASRAGVGDNRETLYTVSGASAAQTVLDAANNLTNTAAVSGINPTAAGEITISLAPSPNNNNANHFTYLGVLRLDPVPTPLRFLPAVRADGQIFLNWTGTGQLESAPTVLGPWQPITPAPTAPYAEPIQPGTNRFFRLTR